MNQIRESRPVDSVSEQPVPRSEGRRWLAFYGAFGVSTVAHLAALLICAWLFVDAGRPWPATDALTLSPPAEQIDFQRDPLDLKRELTLSTAPGSSPATSIRLTNRPLQSRVSAPVQAVAVSRNVFDGGELVSGLAEKVDVNLSGSGGSQGTGNGAGAGNGGGDSAGSGFFGLKSDAKSIVYVLDCSGSMNTRHDSEWKTRFGRLKYEMVRSVAGMTPRQQFFIIFFNKKAIPMPSRGMVPATPDVKQQYLKWMSRQSAVGATDPRIALRTALKLEPDVIYFLTDGAFSPKVRRSLMSIHQYKVAIHTFVFGNPAGEKVMKQIAVQNRGKYTYIP